MAKTPGPGAYSPMSSISKDGSQFYSRYESSKAAHFNPPSSSRFQDFGHQLMTAPGPGQYSPASSLSQTGAYFLAKYHSSQCRTFGKDPRNTLTTSGTHLGTTVQ